MVKRSNVTPSTEIAHENIGDATNVRRIAATETVDLAEHLLAQFRRLTSEQKDRFIAARSPTACMITAPHDPATSRRAATSCPPVPSR